METESLSKSWKDQPEKRRRKWRNCCLCTAATVIIIVVVVVILAFTVFKAKNPKMTIKSLRLSDLDVSLDIARLRVDLNVTLDVDVAVKNPNKVKIKFKNSTANLNYRGELVGEVPIAAGEVPSDGTVDMNVTLTVMADRFLSNSQLISDVGSGILPLNTYTAISGKVTILNLFKVHVDSSSSCDFTIFISNATTSEPQCKYKTKL